LQKQCPESVPFATFLRSVLVRYAYGKLQYTSEHSEHSESATAPALQSSVAQQSATAPESASVAQQRCAAALRSSNQKEHSFLSGIDGMLVDDNEDEKQERT
jgi:hypothetical protein